jgi:SAM-dependent methyltransferase
MSWLGFLPLVLLAGIVLNGLRLRQRVRGLPVIPAAPVVPAQPADTAAAGVPDPRYRLVTAAGLTVDPATLAGAGAFAAREGLAVLDLVPADLPVHRALDLVRAADLPAYRTDRMTQGRTAGHAVLVEAAVLDRAGIERTEGLDPVALAEVAKVLKRFAPATTAFAVAPGLPGLPDDPGRRMGLLQATYGPLAPLALVLTALVHLALAGSVVLRPVWGLAAVAAYCLQPVLVFARPVPVRPRDLVRSVVLRPLAEPVRWVRTARGAAGTQRAGTESPGAPDPYAERRPGYAAELAGGTERFLEPRRDRCPWCGSTELRVRLRTPDLMQRKPGRFVLEQCRDCRHIFQNPRLTVAGLDFYYRDFYDGLGEASTEFMFGVNARPYRDRAEMVAPFTTPRRWLDIGAGHGHFCLTAREVWPEAEFDGLDMGGSIVEAAQRGWVGTGYRGQFLDLVGELAGRYDVLSMHHYLEHTREPLDELDAAAKVLRPGGHLLIEVPNPESRYSRLLGRFWLPWIQPQHQHFIPVGNMRRALADRGFEVVAVDLGRANQAVDLAAAPLLLANMVAPDPRLPWLPCDPSRWRRARHVTLLTAALPVLLAGLLADRLVDLVLRRTSGGNTYRVLAVAGGLPPDGGSGPEAAVDSGA